MNQMEQLIIEQAIYKAVAEDVGTKDPNNLRGQADAFYRQAYEDTGAKTYNLFLDGQVVGSYQVRTTKGTPDSCKEVFHADLMALSDWDLGELTQRYALAHIADYAEFYFRETGEMPPGCEIAYQITEGVPAGLYKTGALVVDQNKVLDALGNRLPDAVRALLGGGSDD